MMADPKRKPHQEDGDSDNRSRQEEALDEALKNTFPASRLGSRYVSGRSDTWIKVKNPAAPAVKREAEEEWVKR